VPVQWDYEKPPFPAPRLLKQHEQWEEVRTLSKWLTSSCGVKVVAMRLYEKKRGWGSGWPMNPNGLETMSEYTLLADPQALDVTRLPNSVEWYFYVGEGEFPTRMRSTTWLDRKHGILIDRLRRITALIRAEWERTSSLKQARGALAQTLINATGVRKSGFKDREGHVSSQKYHSCPYKSEVGNDPISMCNCCASCEQTCADDI
jgi:hypothetical protein